MEDRLFSLASRIAAIREMAGVSQRQFALKLGLAPSYLSAIERGTSAPGAQVLLAIPDIFPAVDCRWLLTGQGPMLKQGLETQESHSADSETGELANPQIRELAEIMQIAQLGDQAEKWKVMRVLYQAGRPLTVLEVHEQCQPAIDLTQVEAYLITLRRQGVVTLQDGRYSLPHRHTVLKTQEMEDVARHAADSIRHLVQQVLPQVEAGRPGAALFMTEARLPENVSRAIVSELVKNMHTRLQQAETDDDGERVCVIIGVSTSHVDHLRDRH